MDTNLIIFDFENNVGTSEWRIVDDVVMGGRSSGHFQVKEEGYGLFSGDVSLENNGGFSSLRHQFNPIKLSGQKQAILKVKGDGKEYQLRFKADSNQRHSYLAEFTTTTEWQIIEINLSDMYPAFRGRKLDIPNFPAETLGELSILIGNKKEESFELAIASLILTE